jgi:hypothetical protein
MTHYTRPAQLFYKFGGHPQMYEPELYAYQKTEILF